jgi:hypothetical protein
MCQLKGYKIPAALSHDTSQIADTLRLISRKTLQSIKSTSADTFEHNTTGDAQYTIARANPATMSNITWSIEVGRFPAMQHPEENSLNSQKHAWQSPRSFADDRNARAPVREPTATPESCDKAGVKHS